MKISAITLVIITFISANCYSQNEFNDFKPKQCFRTADFVNPSSEMIIKTQEYGELCVKFIDNKSANIWIDNAENSMIFTKTELLESDEKIFKTYKATGYIKNEKYEIIYIEKAGGFKTALVLIYDRYIPELAKKVIVQYKLRD